ncbi:MAG: hypothetical protein AAF466_12090 [Bacteroidota bacterium]
MSEQNYILGVASSCDDTAAAIINNGKNLANVVAAQQIHDPYRSVVPQFTIYGLHKNILALVHRALHRANIDKKDLKAIAFTRGPGLMGSLLVRTSFPKSFSMELGDPLIEVTRMQSRMNIECSPN